MKLFAKYRNLRRVQDKLEQAHGWTNTRNPADEGSWRGASMLSVNAAMSPQKRAEYRRKAQLVVENNAYAAGAANAIVSAVAGTMPRLQLSDPLLESQTSGGDSRTSAARRRADGVAATASDETVREESALLTQIENEFSEWAHTIDLADKLRVMRYAKFVDGETFAVLYTNPRLAPLSDVTLDVRVVDCARVTAQYSGKELINDPNFDDGILFNNYGEPISYRILDYNPGDNAARTAVATATTYPAVNVCHWFKPFAPEQRRGISEIAPCIDLFNLIDRYSKAVVQAAETAADLAMVIKTDAVEDETASVDFGANPPAGKVNPVGDDEPFVQFPWSRGMTMTLPEGWDAKQIAAEQPSNSYGMLVDEILAQIGAAINVPKLLMKNSAENYNYSSARVDLQNFQNAVRLDRDSLVHHVLNPIWRAWFLEYRAIHSLDFVPRTTWYFDGFFHVDPLKEANAQITRVQNALSSLAAEYGARGMDWERELRQIAREKAFIKGLEEEYGVRLTADSLTQTLDTTTEDKEQ